MNRKIALTALTSMHGYTIISTLIVLFIVLVIHRPFVSQDTPIVDKTIRCEVIKVVDGDSINVNCNKQMHRLRLLHIDAPERNQSPWGQRATSRLKTLALSHIIVEFHAKDVYHRDLAVIYSDKVKQKTAENALNLQLVKEGLVRVYQRYKPPSNYIAAMKRAKQQKLGIWREKGLHQDPARYRRLSY